jgi:uncharacterized protein (DUF433 family)
MPISGALSRDRILDVYRESPPNVAHRRARTLNNRAEAPAMSETHRITVDPNQCGGRPCLRGLRIRVKDVLDLLAAGADRAEILADYPLLEAGDITAALEYAARQTDHTVLRVA